MAAHMMPETADKLLALLQTRSDLLPMEVLLRTGCRTHELRTLRFTEQGVYITAAKGSKNHHVPLQPAFLARVGMHWASHLAKTSKQCHEAYKATLRAAWGRLRAEHPFLAPYSLHSLRSAFAIKVQAATGDLLLTQALLGHKSLSSTSHYLASVSIESNRARILTAVG